MDISPLFITGAAAAATLLSVIPIRHYFQGGQLAKKYQQRDLSNMVFVITGANVGIGFESAKQLFSQNATVLMLCRTQTKARDAIKEIQTACPKSKGELVFVSLDLLDLESVKKCVQEVIAELNKRHQKIYALINNAGVMHHPHATTKQGFEVQFGTNHLAHFALTIPLLPYIEDTGRIVNVSSLAHTGGTQRINFDNLNSDAKSQGVFDLYNQSKLANVLFTKALDRRLKKHKSNISVVSLHPGVVKTNLMRHHSSMFTLALVPFMWIVFKTAKSGAQTTLHCALADGITPGAYYSDCRVKPSIKTSHEIDFQEKLWDLSKQWTGIEADQVLEAL
eukprot:CAMPEP_0117445002 /NCGR_PEP_ID=MMETSP0759-20121206/5554_1 /TAXON_ID=63605 /ORGANISM="Percolomonas cosmopolitus, Strain WS" /LENGTH=335 /DNA_ID=CAMNT_0005237131 /DNA_START=62 /DNA_END=1069 /DNA_ORIENTATION=+